MSAYPYSEGMEHGTWLRVSDLATGKTEAVFYCPNCGKPCALNGHEVDEDGLVFPKVGFPSDSCSFDQYVELKGWRRGGINV